MRRSWGGRARHAPRRAPLPRLVKEALRMRPSRITGLVIAGSETSADMFKRVVDARAHVVVSGMNVLVAGGTQSGKASI